MHQINFYRIYKQLVSLDYVLTQKGKVAYTDLLFTHKYSVYILYIYCIYVLPLTSVTQVVSVSFHRLWIDPLRIAGHFNLYSSPGLSLTIHWRLILDQKD